MEILLYFPGFNTFKDFSKRLQRDLRTIVDQRLDYVKVSKNDMIKGSTKASGSIDVNVLSHSNQRHAVYTGGSFLVPLMLSFHCHSKAEYDEFGPNICRQSRVFANLF